LISGVGGEGQPTERPTIVKRGPQRKPSSVSRHERGTGGGEKSPITEGGREAKRFSAATEEKEREDRSITETAQGQGKVTGALTGKRTGTP